MAMAVKDWPSSWVSLWDETRARPKQQKFNIPKVVFLTEDMMTSKRDPVGGGYLGPPWQLIFLSPMTSWQKFKALLHEMGHWMIRIMKRSNDYSVLDAMLDGAFKIWYWDWRSGKHNITPRTHVELQMKELRRLQRKYRVHKKPPSKR